MFVFCEILLEPCAIYPESSLFLSLPFFSLLIGGRKDFDELHVFFLLLFFSSLLDISGGSGGSMPMMENG